MKLISCLSGSISRGGDNLKNQLICIVGPTASGKTALSVELAKLRKTEIISADSMQIYCDMNIGTAKPDLTERQGIPHHMFDICAPDEVFSVAHYVQLADACAQDILRRGMTPIVVGGTGLYLDSLILCNTFSGEEADPKLRSRLQNLAREQGNEAVYARLKEVDPRGAENLHPNNLKRVIRALEVYEQTGMTLDELNCRNRRREPKYYAVKIGLCPSSRETLYARINQRVDRMMQDGLLDEVQRLFREKKLSGTAAQAIGYKEFLPYFQQDMSLDTCVELLKQHSRNYAKRQLTWFKRDPTIHWITYEDARQFDEVVRRSTEILAEQGL